MEDRSDDEWHLVRATEYFQPATAILHRKEIQKWGKAPGHWSGSGKHTKLSEVKGKLHVEAVLGHGATGLVERVTFRCVTMARKKIRVRGKYVEELRDEANIMEKLVHRHIVELVGTYTHGQRDLYILTYPAAICNLQSFLDDIEEIGFGASADVPDATKRFEALGFKNVVSTQSGSGELELRLERPLNYLASTLGCVTEAVAFVHKNNIRHQDLKPRNILLSPRQVYLADFGISKDLKDATHSLTESFPGGTPDYRAPEVTQGEKHHMSPADIYSLGCVFLTVASVLYNAAHGQYETVLKEEDLKTKASAIRDFLDFLSDKASQIGKAAYNAPTCAPKHFLNLIESMLSDDPKARPTACLVNTTLHELGGIDQVYHGKCCKKDTTYITQLIDNQIRAAGEGKTDQAKRIQQLQAQHEADRQKIEQLMKTQETYQTLAEKERKHAVEQYEKLLERRTKDLEAANSARKALEAEVAQLRQQRQQPRTSKKGKFPHVNGHVERPQQYQGGPRRPSRVPLPVRPSTPLRPDFGRESRSGSDTLTNSVDSGFSRTTVASSISIGSIRSASPESPLSPNNSMQLPPATSNTNKSEEVEEISRPPAKTMRTWAEIMKPVIQPALPKQTIQNVTTLRPKPIRT